MEGFDSVTVSLRRPAAARPAGIPSLRCLFLLLPILGPS